MTLTVNTLVAILYFVGFTMGLWKKKFRGRLEVLGAWLGIVGCVLVFGVIGTILAGHKDAPGLAVFGALVFAFMNAGLLILTFAYLWRISPHP